MKAAVYERYGPPDVIQIRDVEQPEPADGELLIRVHASTVNRTDTGFRSARYFISRFFTGLFRPKHTVLGTEFAGEVVGIGESVTLFAVGDLVFGYNEKTFGANAEYMCFDQEGMIAHMPTGLSYEEAAPNTEGSHYAITYIKAAGMGEGSRVLVNGASGGIGSAAVQLLTKLGAHVVAVCGTKNIELILELGASRVLNYEKEDFANVLRREGVTFDVVFDAVGKSTFGRCKKLLKPSGKYMSTELGPFAQNVFLALWTRFFGSRRVLFPMPRETKEDVEYIKTLIEEGAYRPVIDRSYMLDDIVEATKYVESGQKTGNVVLKIAPSEPSLT